MRTNTGDLWSWNLRLPVAVCAALLLVVAAVGLGRPAEARYLPTRSDESQLEVLKELMAQILDEANEHQLSSSSSSGSLGGSHQPLMRATRFFSTRNNKNNSRLRHLARSQRFASNEDGAGSSNEDQMFLDAAAALVQRRSAELVAPGLNGGDLIESAAAPLASQSSSQRVGAFLKLREKTERR